MTRILSASYLSMRTGIGREAWNETAWMQYLQRFWCSDSGCPDTSGNATAADRVSDMSG